MLALCIFCSLLPSCYNIFVASFLILWLALGSNFYYVMELAYLLWYSLHLLDAGNETTYFIKNIFLLLLPMFG